MRQPPTDPREATPPFLWDRSISAARFIEVLADPRSPQHDAWLALLLREARPDEVWRWTTPATVAATLPAVAWRLGARRAFWEWLIDGWRADGLVR